jgi:hypothetical protein
LAPDVGLAEDDVGVDGDALKQRVHTRFLGITVASGAAEVKPRLYSSTARKGVDEANPELY